MPVLGPLNFVLPDDVAKQLADAVRARRLADNLTQQTLANMSGVPVDTLRKFESTGKISLLGLLRLADALNCLNDFSSLFPAKPITSIDELGIPSRKRGRR